MAGSGRQSACRCCSGRGRPPCLAGSACLPGGGLAHGSPGTAKHAQHMDEAAHAEVGPAAVMSGNAWTAIPTDEAIPGRGAEHVIMGCYKGRTGSCRALEMVPAAV